ncbi:GNAT family N-acetyltransferase [Leptospira sp. 96542]|nr:GNAT family N-acetyltransferase [Leptospira sp. 96542]
MQNQTITIRQATPSDNVATIPLIHSSGPKAWDFVFTAGSKTSFEFLNYAFTKRGNTISYTNHWVACIEGRVVGSILVYTQPSFSALTVGTALQILSLFKLKSPKVIARGLLVESMIQPPKYSSLYLGHIAVLESERNKGIAKLMMRYVMDLFPKYKTVSLDVSAENPGAIKVYQSLGFQIKTTRSVPKLVGILPDHHYMELNR